MPDSRITAAHELLTEDTVFRYVIAARFAFDGGASTMHTGLGSFTFDGDTYEGVGEFGGVSAIEEDGELRPDQVEFVLSGISTDQLDTFTTEKYRNREARLYVVFLNDDYSVNGDPELMWVGYMDAPELNLSAGGSTIVVRAESVLENWDRPRVSRYTDAEQQRLYPGDLFFDQMERMDGRVINWGGRRITSVSRGWQMVAPLPRRLP